MGGQSYIVFPIERVWEEVSTIIVFFIKSNLKLPRRIALFALHVNFNVNLQWVWHAVDEL